MVSFFDIGTLGTSLTAGSGAKESWHRGLRASLAPGKQSVIRTYNFGVAGGTNVHGLSLSPLISKLKPKVMLIEYSMNECLNDYSTSQTETISIINTIRTASPSSLIYLMIMNPVLGDSLSATSRAPTLGNFYQMYRNIAASREDVEILDTTSNWSGLIQSEIPDGIHPTSETNIARLVPAISSILRPLFN